MCCATAALAKTPGGVAGAGLGGCVGQEAKGGRSQQVMHRPQVNKRAKMAVLHGRKPRAIVA